MKKNNLYDLLLELRSGLQLIDTKYSKLEENNANLNYAKQTYDANQEKKQSFDKDFLETEVKAKNAKNKYNDYINTGLLKRNNGVIKDRNKRSKTVGKSYHQELYLCSFICSVFIAVVIFIILTATVDTSYIFYILTVIPTGLAALVISLPLFLILVLILNFIYIKKSDKKTKAKLLDDIATTEKRLLEYNQPWEEIEKGYTATKNNLLKEAKTCYDKIKLDFEKIIPEYDWILLDYAIYFVQTDKAETVEEALKLAHEQQSQSNFNDNLSALKAALNVNSTSLELVNSKDKLLELL